MKKEWLDAVITGIEFAMYVPPLSGGRFHKDRPYHGLVLNDSNQVTDYYFSNGRVLHVEGDTLFYLPKNSTYTVKACGTGGCYAINFGAELEDVPFLCHPKNPEAIRRSFRMAAEEWQTGEHTAHASSMRALYDAIIAMQRAEEAAYMPHGRTDLIRAALERMRKSYTDPALTVSSLAAECGMSEVYFRRLFANVLGISPKEYIIRQRIAYAERLLVQGEFEVSKIASLCGYSEPCHFSREFKKRIGVTPMLYKKEGRRPRGEG